jgi:hypothetical protein
MLRLDGMRWWLALAIMTFTVVAAWAQPAAGTEQARQAERAADHGVAALKGTRDELVAQFQREKDAIDRLKHERPSWRRDRRLNAELANSKDTADRLAALDQELLAAQTALAIARGKLALAIDAELAAAPAPARAVELTKLRTQLAAVMRAVKKIVIPDAEIDPLADPEDLDAQAAALRASEQELGKQVAGLDNQAKELARSADLRKQHERTIELARRDDDQPLRSQAISHETAASGTLAIGSGSGAASGPPTDSQNSSGERGSAPIAASGPPGFENEATVVLGDVVDQATIDGLARASRSGDPAQRAQAAARTRDAVRARLELLQKKRAAIEARARQLRGAK